MEKYKEIIQKLNRKSDINKCKNVRKQIIYGIKFKKDSDNKFKKKGNAIGTKL